MRTGWSAAVVVAAGVAVAAPCAQAQVAAGAGDAARGRAVVESAGANCLGCHRIAGVGSLYGPDLSAIGAPRGGTGGGRGRGPVVLPRAATREELTQSLLEPDAEVTVENRYVRLDMTDGRTVWGKLLNLDTFAVQIFDSSEHLASIPRDDVRELTMASPMPSYRGRLTPQELADVVAYLMTLTGP